MLRPVIKKISFGWCGGSGLGAVLALAATLGVTGIFGGGCATTPVTQGQVNAAEAITDDVVQALIVGFQDLQAIKNVPAADVATANASIAAYNAVKAEIQTATAAYFASLGTNNPTGTIGGLAAALAKPNGQLLTAAQAVKAAILAAEGNATAK